MASLISSAASSTCPVAPTPASAAASMAVCTSDKVRIFLPLDVDRDGMVSTMDARTDARRFEAPYCAIGLPRVGASERRRAPLLPATILSAEVLPTACCSASETPLKPPSRGRCTPAGTSVW